ncbi:ty3-gypsy retrotransposon protein [Tanacetum coccineum]
MLPFRCVVLIFRGVTQPYRQLTLAKRASNKLTKRYYGPFEVVERVGKVAYRLALPVDSKIHPVFHVSLLKLFSGSDTFKVTPIPGGNTEGHPVEEPVAICGTRAVLCDGRIEQQVLVQWAGRSPEEATWEWLSEFQNAYPAYVTWTRSFLKERGMIRQLFENLGARQGRQLHRCGTRIL